MTKEEYTQLKAYLIGAYQNLVITDIVWYDILKEYDFKMMLRASKNYIKQSSFPPTIASLIKEYELVQKEKIKFDSNYIYATLERALLNNQITEEEFDDLYSKWHYDSLDQEEKTKIIALSGDDKYMKQILMGGTKHEEKLLA